MPSETIDRLTQQFRRERFEAFCRSLSNEELFRPVPDSTWTVTDFVSHLATLDTVLTDPVPEFRLRQPGNSRAERGRNSV